MSHDGFAAYDLEVSWVYDGDRVCEGAVADSSGHTQCEVVPDELGKPTVVLEVRDPDGESDRDEVELWVGDPPPPQLAIIEPEGEAHLHDAQELPFEVQVDHPIENPSDLVLWWESDLEGTLTSELVAEPNDDGTGRVQGTLGPLGEGTHELTATVRSGLGLTTETTATAVVFPQVGTIVLHSGDAQEGTAGQPLDDELVVQALDGSGQPAPNVPVSWLASPGAWVSETQTVTDDQGLAAITADLGTQVGTYTYTARYDAADPVVEVEFEATALPDGPAQLVRLGVDEQTAVVDHDLPEPLAVEVQDQFGNTVPDATVVWEASGDAQVPWTTETDADGQTEVVATLGTVSGPYTFTVELPETEAKKSYTATAEPDEVDGLEMISGNEQSDVVDRLLGDELVVEAQDRHGNAVPEAAVDWTTSNGASITATPLADEDGRSQGVARLGTQVGTYIYTASLPGTDVSLDFEADAEADEPSEIVLIDGDAQTQTVGQSLDEAFEVRVEDQFENPVPDVTVLWEAEDDAQIVNWTVTDDEGETQTTGVLGTTVGTYTFTASVEGAVPPVELDFTATAEAAQPTQLERISGNDQWAQVEQDLPQPLVVEARDKHGNTVPDATLEWSASDDAEVPATSQTDENGLASVTAQLGTSPGAYTFEVAIPDSEEKVTYDAEARPVIDSVEILPTEPFTFDELQADVDHPYDPDDVSFTYRWQLDGDWLPDDPFSGFNGPTVDSDETVKHQEWRVEVTPHAGEVSGEPVLSPPQAILNAPPEVEEIVLATHAPVPDEDLVLLEVLMSDPDGEDDLADPILQWFRWSDTQEDWLEVGDDTEVLSSDIFDVGDLLYLQVTPVDQDALEGEPMDSEVAEVQAPWLDVTAGSDHSCGIQDDGSLWCWGLGVAGQRGDGNTDQTRTSPSRVIDEIGGSGAYDWETVSTGGEHTCGIRTDNTLWCWGAGSDGQLGQGAWSGSAVPVQVIEAGASEGGAAWDDWVEVTTGGAHTCGRRSDGTAWCWGYGAFGRLGTGSNDDTHTPLQVLEDGASAGSGEAWSDWDSLAAGSQHTCGRRQDGSLWCWGHGGNGRRGDGTLTNEQTPKQVKTDQPGEPPWTDWLTVTAGGSHTCGIRQDNSAWCWGNGANGRLGYGSTSSSDRPQLVLAEGALVGSGDAWTSWLEVRLGSRSTCGTRTNGSMWCWGHGGYGRRGDGSDSDTQATPTRVLAHADSEENAWNDWTVVGKGGAHTCGVRSGGSMHCWGRGSDGRRGDGSTHLIETLPSRVLFPAEAD